VNAFYFFIQTLAVDTMSILGEGAVYAFHKPTYRWIGMCILFWKRSWGTGILYAV